MEFNGIILLIDSNTERKKLIETILDFMGIRWHSGSESDSFAYLNDIEEQTAVLVGDLEGTTLSDVLIKYSKVPFVGINVEHEYSSPNMMGTLKPPFNIEDFSQQLRFCQSFFSLHHAKKNQKNSDETLLKLLVGQGSAIKEVRHLIEQVAVTDANVLILGSQVQEKRSLPDLFMNFQTVLKARLFQLTAVQYLLICWNRNCLVMKKELLPEQFLLEKVVLKWLKTVQFFLMKLVICLCLCR